MASGKFVLALIDGGWSVDVVSLLHLPSQNDPNGDNRLPHWAVPWTPLKAVTHQVPVPSFIVPVASRRHAFIKRIVGLTVWIIKSVLLSYRLHSRFPYEVLISRSYPFAAQIPAFILSKITRLPWVANWNDPVGIIVPYSIPGVSFKLEKSKRIFRFIIRLIARCISWHTFPSERLRVLYKKVYGKRLFLNSSVVPHAAIHLPPIVKKDAHASRFSICHAGSISSDGRSPEVFFQGLRLFLDRLKGVPPVRFVMIGRYHRGLDALLEKYRLTGIVNCVGPLDYYEAISLTAGCDVLLIVEGDYGKGYFLPSKLIDYVQVGKPILAISPKKGTVSDIIRKNGGGVLADGRSAKSVSDALALLFKHWERGSLQQTFSSHKLLRLFSTDAIVGHYERIVEKISCRCSEDGLRDRN